MERFTVVQGNKGSNRGMWLDKFLERLNPTRVAQGYKPYNHARIGMMLAHVPTDDLAGFYKQCEQAGIPFGAYFHWAIKAQTNGKNMH